MAAAGMITSRGPRAARHFRILERRIPRCWSRNQSRTRGRNGRRRRLFGAQKGRDVPGTGHISVVFSVGRGEGGPVRPDLGNRISHKGLGSWAWAKIGVTKSSRRCGKERRADVYDEGGRRPVLRRREGTLPNPVAARSNSSSATGARARLQLHALSLQGIQRAGTEGAGLRRTGGEGATRAIACSRTANQFLPTAPRRLASKTRERTALCVTAFESQL